MKGLGSAKVEPEEPAANIPDLEELALEEEEPAANIPALEEAAAGEPAADEPALDDDQASYEKAAIERMRKLSTDEWEPDEPADDESLTPLSPLSDNEPVARRRVAPKEDIPPEEEKGNSSGRRRGRSIWGVSFSLCGSTDDVEPDPLAEFALGNHQFDEVASVGGSFVCDGSVLDDQSTIFAADHNSRCAWVDDEMENLYGQMEATKLRVRKTLRGLEETKDEIMATMESTPVILLGREIPDLHDPNVWPHQVRDQAFFEAGGGLAIIDFDERLGTAVTDSLEKRGVHFSM